jgi:hypothetical protein
MKPIEIEVKAECARREMEYWKSILTTKGCGNCKQFKAGACELAGGITPPPDVQKTGCPEWAWDSIPF